MEPSSDHDIPHDEGSSSRRPMNAFLLFCKRHRAIVKEKFPNLENRNITKILGEWWQSLSDDEKANFNNLASEYKEHVMREQPNFRWRKPPTTSTTSPHFTKSQTTANKFQSVNGGHSDSSHAVVRQPTSLRTAKPYSEPGLQEEGHGGSSTSSNSSSPEPSLVHASSAAPKPFKKRYLAAAKLFNPSELQAPVSPDAEHACKALLQLAGVRESSPTDGIGSNNGSRSGTSSPPSEGQPKPQGFNSLRDAVWGRVARTLLKQEEEKGSRGQEDAPLNLSSQCTIRGQTIIEHIIENILDMPRGEGEQERPALNLNNNNGNVDNTVSEMVSDETAEEIKERIYQGLKQDILKRAPGDKDRSALWNVLPQSNISTPKNSMPPPTLVQKQVAAAPTVAKARSFTAGRDEHSSTEDDASKLNIKNLLAQSPAPLSPRSKIPCPSTASLTNAVIASVLQQQQPVELFLPQLRPTPPVSVTLVTTTHLEKSETHFKPLNLSTTPPQTPSVSLTPVNEETSSVTITPAIISPSKRKLVISDEDDDEIRRSSRSCKGRRYQEFKDEGRLGKKSGGSSGRRSYRSGDSVDADDNISLAKLSSSDELQTAANETTASNTQSSLLLFDVATKLNAIPALSLEVYQQRVLKAKSASSLIGCSSSNRVARAWPAPESSSLQQSSGDSASTNQGSGRRKTRRGGGTMLTPAGKKSAEQQKDLIVSS